MIAYMTCGLLPCVRINAFLHWFYSFSCMIIIIFSSPNSVLKHNVKYSDSKCLFDIIHMTSFSANMSSLPKHRVQKAKILFQIECVLSDYN